MATEGGFAAIAERHRQASGSVDIEVMGETVTIRRIASASDLMKVERYAALQARVCTGPNRTRDWEQWGELTESTVRMAAYMTQVLVEPRCTMPEALMLAGTAGAFFLALNARIMHEIGFATAEAEEEAVAEEGEPSSPEAGTGTTQ